MSPEEIQAMAKGLAEGQAVWYLGSAVIGGAITGLGTYLAEKGKNRATKEDIGEITRAVKEIEAGFNEKLADLQAHHQLRMVAAERRIQAHQDAYDWISQLRLAIHYSAESWGPLIREAHIWQRRNNLFMGRLTRESFALALCGFERFRGQKNRIERSPISSENFDDDKEYETLNKIWNEEIIPVFQVIASEVELPPLGEPPRIPSPT